MPGVLVKYALVMERTAHGPFLSVEDLVAPVGRPTKGDCRKSGATPAISASLEGRLVFDGGKKQRPTPWTTRLSLFVPFSLRELWPYER
jgi:hypothetical protein